MTLEEEEYWEEWKEMKKQEMLRNFNNFLSHKKQEIQEVNREILEMENDSEEELNLFENFANTRKNIKMKHMKDF